MRGVEFGEDPAVFLTALGGTVKVSGSSDEGGERNDFSD